MRTISVFWIGLIIFASAAWSQDNTTRSTAGASSGGFTDDVNQAAEEVKGFFGNLFGKSRPDESDQRQSDQTVKNKPSADVPATPVKEVQPAGREQVLAIQTKLAARGYDIGPLDGLMGSRTRNAIRSYQREVGLPIDGRPSATLLHSLSSGQVPVAIQAKRAEFAALLDGSAAAQEGNDYEGALHNDDYVCEIIVDEFKISGGLIRIVKSGASKVSSWFEQSFVTGNADPSLNDNSELERIEAETRLAAKRTNWMPLVVEQRYGEIIHQHRLQQAPEVISRRVKGRKAKQYRQADMLLEELLEQIPQQHPYQFKLYLVDDAEANAEAVPGGYIYLSTGALNKQAARLILGHEITHVTKRHTTRELQARLIDSVATMEDIKDLMTDRNPESGAIVKRAAALKGRFLHYSRQQELQADACSVRLAMGLHGVNMMKEINRYVAGIGSTEVKEELSTSEHPAYPERRERMLQVVQMKQTMREPQGK